MNHTTPPSPSAGQPTKEATKPEWSYHPYRAMLKRNGKTFAIVTPDLNNALSIEDAKILTDGLNSASLAEAVVEAAERAVEAWRNEDRDPKPAFYRMSELSQSVAAYRAAGAKGETK